MTNEEIEQKANAYVEKHIVADGILTDEGEKESARVELMNMVCELVAQAYEEAAQTLDRRVVGLRTCVGDERFVQREIHDRMAEAKENAASIRSLKYPLVAEKVSS
jgi:hypothetical protein